MMRLCHSAGHRIAIAVIVAGLRAWPAVASITTPLQIVATEPILNEFGEVIEGHANMAPAERPMVQLLWAPNGIYPPNLDGSPHPENPPVEGGIASIGHLVAPSLERPGLFAMTLADPRPVSGQVFVRVYNAPTIESSIFYGDSEIISFGAGENATLIANVEMLNQIIDPDRDSDGDGLPDWWEHLNSGDATAADPDDDSDGDGMSAWEEFMAGTDPNDPDSYLGIIRVEPTGMANLVVEWRSVPGRRYCVEYSGSDFLEELVFEAASDVTEASETTTSVEIPGALINGIGHFRIRMIAD